VLRAACLLAAALVAIALEAGRLVVSLSDYLTLIAVTVAVVALSIVNNIGHWAVNPTQHP